ncbi:MAG: hypothetical protein K2M06_01375 [Muribaculaceae bacterium]|nr:hypothetical protein [Muribaculaceae bacterium]
MSKKFLNILLFTIGLGLLAACGSKDVRKPQGLVADQVEVVPLYRYFAERDSASVMSRPELLRTFLEVVHYPTDSLSSGALYWCTSLPVRVFTPAVDSIFGPEGAPLDKYVGYTLAAARAEGLPLPRRTYAAVVYGRREPMGFSDSTMLIALNHYLGADYEGYQGFPMYERVLKIPSQIPYDIAEALVGTERPYQAPADGATVLSRMLYGGATGYARYALVENSTEAAALGYSDEQWAWLLEHEGELWRELIAKKLLYDTDPQTAQKLVDPTPATTILSMYSPGRVGRFLGYRMVCRYLEKHPEASVATLLSPDFYNNPAILDEIEYSPGN